jgi:DNA-binding MarR family transcriptional regulator
MKPDYTRAGAAATELILEIFRANGQLLAAGDRLMKALSLSSARWQVLGAIAEGPATVAQIARMMGLARQSVQRIADVLAEEGLVRFDPNPNHRRASLLRLTEEGQHRSDEIARLHAVWINDLTRGAEPQLFLQAACALRELQTRLRNAHADEPGPTDDTPWSR